MLFKICVLLIFISKIHKSFGSAEEWTENSRECVTPKTQTGACIALKECPIIFDMFGRFKELLESERQIVKDSQCGYDFNASEFATKMFVCCPTVERRSSVDEMLLENVEIDNAFCGMVMKIDNNVVERMSSTSDSNFPWMALIEYVHVKDPTRRGFNCSGTLINNRYILTAAHCMKNIYWKPHRIRLGNWDPNSDIDCENKIDCPPTNARQFTAEIDEIIVHPNYPVDLYHDIALIRLKQHIEYTNYIRPICLPFGYILDKPNLANVIAEFASWGLSKDPGAMVGSSKFKIPLRIWNTHECRKRYRIMGRDINSKYEMCAGGEQGVDTCKGDSGGAMMYSVNHDNMKVYYIAGVMVGGTDPCGLLGWPNISIDIQSHLQWILYQLTE